MIAVTDQTIDALISEKELWLSKANELEKQSKEAAENAHAIQKTIDLVKMRIKEENEKQIILPLKDKYGKYKNANFPDAIEDILKNHPGLDSNEIAKILLEEGFISNSKTFKSDVRTKLWRMTKNKEIIRTETATGKRYRLATENDE